MMTDVYKHGSITNELFSKMKTEYNLRTYKKLAFHRKPVSRYSLERVNYKASQLWQNAKNSCSLEIFKLKIKSWTADKCPCWVC